MKRLNYWYWMILLFMCECGSEPKKEPQANKETVKEDSIVEEKVDTVLTGETISFFNQSGFSDYVKSKSSGFDWNKFRLVNVWKEDSMLTTVFHPDKNYFQVYGQLLKYSPDSLMFIDLDSYNINIHKNAQGKLIGSEEGPDTQVSLVDMNNHQKKRLVFLGPGSTIEDGGWIDNDNIVLAGVQESGGGGRTAAVWKYHIPTNTFFLFESPDKLTEKIMASWRKQRLKQVQLQ